MKSHWLETFVGVVIPPACREEVLGDLHERSTTPSEYAVDALRTVPIVILSRIRRTSNPELVAMQAIGLYLCFFIAAWVLKRGLLYEQSGLWRLAIPGAAGLLALALEDAYGTPGSAFSFRALLAPIAALLGAFISQAVLWAAGSRLTLPLAIAVEGSLMGLLIVYLVRLLFLPPSRWRRGPI